MLDLSIRVEQHGPHIHTTYKAVENTTTTPAEKRAITDLLDTIQKLIAAKGGRGQFVQRDPQRDLGLPGN